MLTQRPFTKKPARRKPNVPVPARSAIPNPRPGSVLVVDVSNSFTKFAVASRGSLGETRRISTSQLGGAEFHQQIEALDFDRVTFASVVPSANPLVRQLRPGATLEVSAQIPLGIGIDYPEPMTIGADRLANAVACVGYHGTPAVVVDFGTAVTFDVISDGGTYLGGVIAPGLDSLTEYLHSHTALLPRIVLSSPVAAIGKSTEQAMQSGAVFGYCGMVREIVERVRAEAFGATLGLVLATGGDAQLISNHIRLFDAVVPELTLQGIELIDRLN